MKKIILFVVSISLFIFAQNESREVKTVEKVDLTKYTGLWYEIAKLPNSFQEDCIKNTTAEYFFDDDGSLKVRNSCTEKDNEANVENGDAKVEDQKTGSKLKVSFTNIVGVKIYNGDYWIIDLGPNYEYSVVVTPDREYAWILSRTKKLPENLLEKAFKSLTDQGFDRNKFVFSVQE